MVLDAVVGRGDVWRALLTGGLVRWSGSDGHGRHRGAAEEGEEDGRVGSPGLGRAVRQEGTPAVRTWGFWCLQQGGVEGQALRRACSAQRS